MRDLLTSIVVSAIENPFGALLSFGVLTIGTAYVVRLAIVIVTGGHP